MVFENFIIGGVWAYLMIFARVGATLMIMPGTGDSFTPIQVRLMFAFAFCFLLTPVLADSLPPMPGNAAALGMVLVKEVLVGVFFGTVARILMAMLDTMGMVVSLQSSLANAQLFNPILATQGSLIGALFSMLGLVLLFALNLHQVLLTAIINSYDVIPAKEWVFPAEDFANALAAVFAKSFTIAIQLILPFFIIILMLYIAMGVLARLMPQLQIFVFAIPIQVLLSLFILMSTLQVIMISWGTYFGDMIMDLTGGSYGR